MEKEKDETFSLESTSLGLQALTSQCSACYRETEAQSGELELGLELRTHPLSRVTSPSRYAVFFTENIHPFAQREAAQRTLQVS